VVTNWRQKFYWSSKQCRGVVDCREALKHSLWINNKDKFCYQKHCKFRGVGHDACVTCKRVMNIAQVFKIFHVSK